jgi:hypothetical protein
MGPGSSLGATVWGHHEAIGDAAEWTGRKAAEMGKEMSETVDDVKDGVASGANKLFGKPFDRVARSAASSREGDAARHHFVLILFLSPRGRSDFVG